MKEQKCGATEFCHDSGMPTAAQNDFRVEIQEGTLSVRTQEGRGMFVFLETPYGFFHLASITPGYSESRYVDVAGFGDINPDVSMPTVIPRCHVVRWLPEDTEIVVPAKLQGKAEDQSTKMPGKEPFGTLMAYAAFGPTGVNQTAASAASLHISINLETTEGAVLTFPIAKFTQESETGLSMYVHTGSDAHLDIRRDLRLVFPLREWKEAAAA